MTFAAVFAYEVEPAAAEVFEAAYGPEGTWAAFFRGGDGYRGTELWCSTDDGPPRRYLVVDRWSSATAYDRFLATHEEEYRRRSRDAEALYTRETLIGRFSSLAG